MDVAPHKWILIVILVLAAPRDMAAQGRTYGLDEDPIRLGMQSLYAGRLVEAQAHFQTAIADEYQLDRAMFGLGELAVRQGQPENAEALYRQAIETRRQSGKEAPRARAGLGLLLVRLGRTAEAALEFEAALGADDELWDAIYGQALLLLAEGQWNKAKDRLDEGSRREGVAEGEDRYHYGLALYYRGMKETGNAEKEALRALHLDPSNPEHAVLVGELYEAQNAPSLAIDAFEQALAAPGVTATAPMLNTLGTLHEKVNDFDDALQRYTQAVAADSTYAPAVRNLAVLFQRGKQPEHAARTYLRYVLLEPQDVEALLGLAASCYEIGHYGQSVEAARTALEIDPANESARYELARAGIHSRDPKTRNEAADLFASLGGSYEWEARDYAALAAHEIRGKNYSRARSTLQRALAAFPDNPDIWFQNGILDLSTGQAASAVTHLEAVAGARPEFMLAHLNLGIAYLQAQRTQEAVAPLRKALELNEGLTRGRLLLAQALAGTEALTEAEQEYRTVLDAEPRNSRALRGLAFCCMRREAYDEAARSYASATEIDPNDAEAWAGLGNAQLGRQDWAAAEKAFLEAKSLDPENETMKKGLELLEQAKAQNKNG